MVYLQRRPHPLLRPFIRLLWYACDPAATHRHERVLPTGCAEIVISLARDYLTDANHPADPGQHSAPAIFLGVYSRHQCIDTIDFAELMGITFQPGGTRAFFPDDADAFTNRAGGATTCLSTDRAAESAPDFRFFQDESRNG
jgi:hypothetical protein